jgi:hypothetical protein
VNLMKDRLDQAEYGGLSMKTRATFAVLALALAALSAQSAFADGAKCAALASTSFDLAATAEWG